jgi:hypothetical protein
MSLDTLLQDAVTQAIALGGYRVTLNGGLFVEIKLESDVLLRLTLSRAHQPPSQTEWETVLKYWPWVVTNKPQVNGNALTAVLVIHPKYFQQSLLPLVMKAWVSSIPILLRSRRRWMVSPSNA